MSNQKLRPQIHFTPQKGWMNDPNGLVFYQGKYHLFYQHDPDSLVWDTMHWGHAVSSDLMYWEHLPIALYPDELGVIYSGSCIVDTENVTGFGSSGHPALVAYYTSHDMETSRECQCMAWSTDGISFHKYEGNPILPGKAHTPSRDPQVFRNAVSGGYSMVLTRESCVEFYHSENLIRWEKTGEFRLPEYALSGMIECPCIFKADVQGGHPDFDPPYVLMLSMDIPESEFSKIPSECPAHARLMQYFVGSFDGNTFHVFPDQDEVLLVDYGPDFYAGSVFSDVKDTILLAWLGDFSSGARNTPMETEGFRGIQCFPRKLTLVHTGDGYRLHHEFYFPGSKVFPEGVIFRTEDKDVILKDNCVIESIRRDGLIAKTSFAQ